MVQVRGSDLVRVESAKRISKYDRLMKLVIVFADLVTIRCNYLQYDLCMLILMMQKWSMNFGPTDVAASARISRHLSNTSRELPKHSNKISSHSLFHNMLFSQGICFVHTELIC